MHTYQIKYFLCVCKEGNLSRASEKLNITQQGLSKAIRTLEEELNVPLFIRNANRMTLSVFGEYALKRLTQIDQEIDDFVRNVTEMERSTQNVVNITILEGFFKDKSFAIDDLLGTLPSNVTINFESCSVDECEARLEKGLTDICITKAPVDHAQYDVFLRKMEPFYALVPSDNPLSDKDILSVVDLREQPVIIMNEEYKFYRNFFSRCKKHGFSPLIKSTVNEVSAIFLPSMLGKGIGIVPSFAIRSVRELPGIRIVSFDEGMSEEICFLLRKDYAAPRAVKAFLREFKQM